MSILILAAARTAVGSFGGSLKSLNSVDLGSTVLAAAVDRAGLDRARVGEVVLGNVLQAGAGQNVARLAALKAGLPVETPAVTINQVCGSGLRAVALAAQGLAEGDHGFALAGGTESMSSAPYLLPAARWGAPMGATRLVDGMIQDGLWCGHGDVHMGLTAENIAAKHGIGREAQDAFAVASQRKAAAASAAGAFVREIVPVALAGRKGDTVFAADECLRADATLEGLARLTPAFRQDGTVTAGNASGFNDGAAALLLAREDAAPGLKPVARILGFAQAGVEPAFMGLGPVPAIRRLLAKTGLGFDQVDRWELNEAFAAQCLGVLAELPEIDPAKVNVRGGAIALGHPIGASGARILVTLLHLLEDEGLKTGVAALCVGGGMGVAMAVERV